MKVKPSIGSCRQLVLTSLLGLAFTVELMAAPVALVELAVVERKDIVETLRLTGSLSSPLRARLSPDVEGRLISLEVDA